MFETTNQLTSGYQVINQIMIILIVLMVWLFHGLINNG